MTWTDLSYDVRSFSPDSWGPSWGLTWEAAQDDLIPRGRALKLKFEPVRWAVVQPPEIRATGRVAQLVAVGSSGAASRPVAACVVPPVITAGASIALLRPVGRAHVAAAAHIQSVAASAKTGRLPVHAAGSFALRPLSAGSVLGVLPVHGGASAGLFHAVAVAWHEELSPSAVRNLTDDELVMLLVAGRNRQLLTARLN